MAELIGGVGIAGSIGYIIYKYLTTPYQWPEKPKTVTIIGAGFSGICLGIKLKERGIPFEIFEKSGKAGGTWFDNIYPGSGCDVPSYLYSYSFAQLSWKRKWSKQDEILKYLNDVIEQFGIEKYINYNCEIMCCKFLENQGVWEVQKKNGEKFYSHVVVSAVGQLNQPNFPNIEGIDSFKGESFHTARWNSNVQLENKRVGIIGNGASAIQIIPEVAKVVKDLTIFQRTPSYIDEKNDYFYPPWMLFLFNYVPLVRTLYRIGLYISFEMYYLFLQRGKLNERVSDFFQKKMKTLSAAHLHDTVIPAYLLGCKRILISSDYFPAIQRENVHLVNAPVTRITETGLIAGDQACDFDVIIYATGFKASNFLSTFSVSGLASASLHEAWGEKPHGFWGMSVPNFPNFFVMYGPTTNLVHNSIIFMIECQANYIRDAIDTLQDPNLKYLHLKQSVMDDYLTDCYATMEKSVFTTECGSWYKTASGLVVVNSPFSTLKFWWNTSFNGFTTKHYNLIKRN